VTIFGRAGLGELSPTEQRIQQSFFFLAENLKKKKNIAKMQEYFQ
jgi:hypothetical protein